MSDNQKNSSPIIDPQSIESRLFSRNNTLMKSFRQQRIDQNEVPVELQDAKYEPNQSIPAEIGNNVPNIHQTQIQTAVHREQWQHILNEEELPEKYMESEKIEEILEDAHDERLSEIAKKLNDHDKKQALDYATMLTQQPEQQVNSDIKSELSIRISYLETEIDQKGQKVKELQKQLKNMTIERMARNAAIQKYEALKSTTEKFKQNMVDQKDQLTSTLWSIFNLFKPAAAKVKSNADKALHSLPKILLLITFVSVIIWQQNQISEIQALLIQQKDETQDLEIQLSNNRVRVDQFEKQFDQIEIQLKQMKTASRFY